jgi:hypothetical protein
MDFKVIRNTEIALNICNISYPKIQRFVSCNYQCALVTARLYCFTCRLSGQSLSSVPLPVSFDRCHFVILGVLFIYLIPFGFLSLI